MITWEQVPLKEQQALRLAFTNDPSIKKLDQLAAQLQHNRDFIGALEVKKRLLPNGSMLNKLISKVFNLNMIRL